MQDRVPVVLFYPETDLVLLQVRFYQITAKFGRPSFDIEMMIHQVFIVEIDGV